MWGLFCSLLYSLAFGALLHLLYDGIRILRALCGVRYGGRLGARLRALRFPGLSPDFASRPPRRAGERLRAVLVFFTDLLFTATAGVLFSVFIYWQNDGAFRAILLLGTLLGYTVFHLTLGRLIVASAEGVAFLLRVLLSYLFLCIRVPATLVARAVSFVARALLALVRRILLFLYERLRAPAYHRREEKRRLRAAFAGLLPKE